MSAKPGFSHEVDSFLSSEAKVDELEDWVMLDEQISREAALRIVFADPIAIAICKE